jgi:hypothetical protein
MKMPDISSIFLNSQLDFAFFNILPNLQPRPPQRFMDIKIGRLQLFTVFHKLSEADVDYILQKQGPLAKGIRLVQLTSLYQSIQFMKLMLFPSS